MDSSRLPNLSLDWLIFVSYKKIVSFILFSLSLSLSLFLTHSLTHSLTHWTHSLTLSLSSFIQRWPFFLFRNVLVSLGNAQDSLIDVANVGKDNERDHLAFLHGLERPCLNCIHKYFLSNIITQQQFKINYLSTNLFSLP